MKCEFLVDENQNMWFTFADNIKFRECKDKLTPIEANDGGRAAVNMAAHQAAQKELLLQELREYEESLLETGSSNVKK